jgi:nucleotide-binding universal stress UspA family protein
MRILVAYDGSADADAAIDDLRFAGLPARNQVMIASVVHENWPPVDPAKEEPKQPTKSWKVTMKETELLAERGKRRMQALFPESVISSDALWGAVDRTILKAAYMSKTELIVVGMRGHSFLNEAHPGSVPTAMLNHAPCSVRIVPYRRRSEGDLRILVATDGSQSDRLCVEHIARRTWPRGTRTRVVAALETAVSVPEILPHSQRNRLRRALDVAAGHLDRIGLVADTALIERSHGICHEVERFRADAVFVAARCLGSIDRLFPGRGSSAVVPYPHPAVEVVR